MCLKESQGPSAPGASPVRPDEPPLSATGNGRASIFAAIEEDKLARRAPGRVARIGKIGGQPTGLSPSSWNDIKLCCGSGLIAQSDPVGDPSAVGRERGMPASSRQETFARADAADHVSASAVALRTERDQTAVGRDVGLAILGGIAGQTTGL